MMNMLWVGMPELTRGSAIASSSTKKSWMSVKSVNKAVFSKMGITLWITRYFLGITQ